MPLRFITSIASSAVCGTRPLNIHPTKNPISPRRGPSGSITSGTCSRNVIPVRATLRPVSCTSVATSWWRGKVNPRRFAISRSFSIALPGTLISFGQTSRHRLQVVQ